LSDMEYFTDVPRLAIKWEFRFLENYLLHNTGLVS